ncbi:hypothetical protein FOMPIDRAFT_89889 [Fomitopsis schrenkii]|uniref:Uncharacterized protein n=1 Tax=Fomitopsis schrenkii TaxID=2126942 RepID=S8E8T4_FOMSC|nr:hypothetical protein FOMPIDRAFT_89889 [Fomitopsis schrenkii]
MSLGFKKESVADPDVIFGDLGAAPPASRPGAQYKLSSAPPSYFHNLPKAGLRLVFCDKPRTVGGYANIVTLVEQFCARKLAKKKPLEPDRMLVKLVLARDGSIPQAIPAHLYVIDWVPNAKYDPADVRWKDLEDLQEHEIWALRESQRLLVDGFEEFVPINR